MLFPPPGYTIEVTDLSAGCCCPLLRHGAIRKGVGISMKKLFDKDEVWFAVVWILVYVIGFGNADSLSEALGIPKLLTVLLGLVLSAVLLCFIYRNRLAKYFGLCKSKVRPGTLLWLLPLAVISSVNLWNGVQLNMPLGETVLYILSMCFVGLLEELIFRGLLFKGMCRSNVTAAIVVSSLTFGVGHIVNLLLGEPVFDTVLQLIYATAIGFCFTALFHVSGSLLPCILCHAIVNSLSAFAVTPSPAGKILMAAAQTLVSLGYGVWLLWSHKAAGKFTESS